MVGRKRPIAAERPRRPVRVKWVSGRTLVRPSTPPAPAKASGAAMTMLTMMMIPFTMSRLITEIIPALTANKVTSTATMAIPTCGSSPGKRMASSRPPPTNWYPAIVT